MRLLAEEQVPRTVETPAGPSCEKADLETVEPGTLTIGTDKPAFQRR